MNQAILAHAACSTLDQPSQVGGDVASHWNRRRELWLLLNDGLLKLTVDSVQGEQVHTSVVAGGELSNNKGINRAGGGLTAPALTAKDMEDIKTAMSFQCEYLAISFP